MFLQSRSLTRALSRIHPSLFSAFCITAAFGTYFCMYGFRKPFTAGTFEDEFLWGVGYKTVLVISQVFGYTVSKFIGIKVVSEMPPHRRAVGILALIGFSQLALLLFGLAPPPYNFICLFFNGLPLGMVFGLVLGFLEGRRLTEALSAGLCASFIIASGVVKSVGRFLVLEWGVTEYWMPFLTGLIFAGPLLIFVWLLQHIPAPTEEDKSHRSERPAISGRDRRQYFGKYVVGLCLLIATYILLTILRSLRDDFAVEIWDALGVGEKPGIYTLSETAIAVAVLIINGAAIAIANNRTAFLGTLGLMIAGFVSVAAVVFGYLTGGISGPAFMILTGLGLYVPYVAYHTTLFERMIAVFRDKMNIGYLMYLADAMGYLGYVAVMLFKDFGAQNVSFLSLFIGVAVTVSLSSAVLVLVTLLYFRRKMPFADSEIVETELLPERRLL